VRPQKEDKDNFIHIWLEELFTLAESSSSAPIYPLLKRKDERFVTMQAYDNPVFVEDMVRNAAVKLREDPRISWYEVSAFNDESIHDHKAFAVTTWTRE
jgi:GTP cyclohydrolase I